MGIVLFAWLFVVGAQATPFVRPTSYDLPIPYPEDVRVRLTSAQEVWILGERISVQLDVQNRGSTPVPYSSDSPSHLRHPPALGRNTRVAVTAVDGEGHVAADPYPYNISAETETWTRL